LIDKISPEKRGRQGDVHQNIEKSNEHPSKSPLVRGDFFILFSELNSR